MVYAKGWVASNDGNISIRLDQNRILATPTGVSKGKMEPDDLIICDLNGNKIEGRKVVETPSEHFAPVIDIMEALKKSLAEKRKPAMVATAAASAETGEIEEAPKKRARKSKVG